MWVLTRLSGVITRISWLFHNSAWGQNLDKVYALRTLRRKDRLPTWLPHQRVQYCSARQRLKRQSKILLSVNHYQSLCTYKLTRWRISWTRPRILGSSWQASLRLHRTAQLSKPSAGDEMGNNNQISIHNNAFSAVMIFFTSKHHDHRAKCNGCIFWKQ